MTYLLWLLTQLECIEETANQETIDLIVKCITSDHLSNDDVRRVTKAYVV